MGDRLAGMAGRLGRRLLLEDNSAPYRVHVFNDVVETRVVGWAIPL